MNKEERPIQETLGGYTTFLNEPFYKISNYDALEPFFMSLISSSDHWLFISSNGGLSAGRVDSEQALFPYYTEDKLADNHENTGSKTILRVTKGEQTYLWEPFSQRQFGQFTLEKNLYKNVPGTTLVFEEINHSLLLTCRYAWNTSEKFGFVKTVFIENIDQLDGFVHVELLDGLQNFIPANVGSGTQNALSCLLDAYKRSELNPETGLGIFTLNSILTDLAEPSESLLATTVYQVGLKQPTYLLSSLQLDHFRSGNEITQESEVRARRGAYFVHAEIDLRPSEETSWYIIADTNQDAAKVANLLHMLKEKPEDLINEITQDIRANAEQLCRIVSSGDGLQLSDDMTRTSHHFSNVLFNVMRGGIFADQYWIDSADFIDYVSTHLKHVHRTYSEFFASLPQKVNVSSLHSLVDEQHSPDLVRLVYTYLPLTFSRRHGDPSRPWNKFSINIKKDDGGKRLDYEGNWRDIFQNWEALAYSYPGFVEGMIFTFLSATTADGYNPYRITRSGIEWEVPDPGNPWANIGYWSDHQIIYLLKLMEISTKVHPGKLSHFLERSIFSSANVPYRIKPYADLVKDPFNTILFDQALDDEIAKRVEAVGMDGKLLFGADGQVLHCSLVEKMLTLLLAKLVNFVPEGGIWMNTQRPEWNDANNALVGKGLSVVTLSYLRRYIIFFQDLLKNASATDLSVSQEVAQFFSATNLVLEKFQTLLASSFNDQQRREMMDALGQIGSDFRWNVYTQGFSGEKPILDTDDLLAFLGLSQRFIEHSLRANKRTDQLYHSYNILHLSEGKASVGHLQEMLEGQVAVLSSQMLSADESLALLQSLRESALYRADQNSYILYPDRNLLDFVTKNTLTTDQVKGLLLPGVLDDANDKSLLVRDMEGNFHFSGNLHNAKDLKQVLNNLSMQARFADLIKNEGEKILSLFEEVFQHTKFTGRSGTFFGYEGLGSVYWHMVSKLLLASQEAAFNNRNSSVSKELVEKYFEISAGLGFNKTPTAFGAFPTDPYSHTPKGQGARQPGMTGYVKEVILARQAEVGWDVENGCLNFNALFLDPKELRSTPSSFSYFDVADNPQHIDLMEGSLAYTICQVPVIVQLADEPVVEVHLTDGTTIRINNHQLDAVFSQHIFNRDGIVHHLRVFLPKKN